MEEDELDSDVEFQDSREVLPARSLADSIAVPRFTPAALESNIQPSSTGSDSHINRITESGESSQVLNLQSGTGAISTADLIEDAKFYQDALLLGTRMRMRLSAFSRKSCNTGMLSRLNWLRRHPKLFELWRPESSARHKEYVALQNQWEAEIQQAIGEAVSQYQHQLSSVQSSLQRKDKEYQHSIQKLQDQV